VRPPQGKDHHPNGWERKVRENMDPIEMMRALNGVQPDFKDGNIVIPKGLMVLNGRQIAAFTGLRFSEEKDRGWFFSTGHLGLEPSATYCIPDPSYNPNKQTKTPKKSPLTHRIESREAELDDLKELVKLEQEIASEAKATQEKRLKAKLLRIKWKVK
jgi:hypothetical protein